MENMKCKNCNVDMEEGTAFSPVLGNGSDKYAHGQCIYPVGAALTSVMKCPECGYSKHYNGSVLAENCKKD